MTSINLVSASKFTVRQMLSSPSLYARRFFICCKWLSIALLSLSLAHSMARLFWLLMPEPSVTPIGQSSQPSGLAALIDTNNPVDIESLKALSLFDNPAEVTNKPVQSPLAVNNQAKQTLLSVKLNGVFASSDPTEAYAIISQGKKQSLYRVDEELANLSGVKLITVLPDRVIIDNNGKSEAILLYPEGEQPSSSDGVHYEDTVKQASFVNEVSDGLIQQQKNQRLSDIVKISMARENGAVVGFRVRPGRNRQLFDNFGLQTNDIITAVNGTELVNSEVAMEVYRSMRNATAASVQVKRGDEELSINIDLAALGLQN